uniref:Dynein light chain Tctex-type family member 5 n=1 Tax=Pongo abelii TaxID=9601 RepID=H2N747_PONAB
MMMSDNAKDRAARSWKKRGSISSLSNHEFWQKQIHGRIKEWETDYKGVAIPTHVRSKVLRVLCLIWMNLVSVMMSLALQFRWKTPISWEKKNLKKKKKSFAIHISLL